MPGVATYNIYKATYYEGPYNLLSPWNVTCYTDAKVAMSPNYYYMVTSITAGTIESAKSNYVIGRLCSSPYAPENVCASKGTDADKITITWTINATATSGYEIYRSTSVSGPYASAATVPKAVTQFIDTSPALSAGIRYFYKVVSNGTGLKSGFSIYDIGYLAQ